VPEHLQEEIQDDFSRAWTVRGTRSHIRDFHRQNLAINMIPLGDFRNCEAAKESARFATEY
jgi:hypothetical protein